MTNARWIDRSDDLQGLIDVLVDEPRVGIDTEFHRERTYWPVCALVQVAWSGGRALIDPLEVDLEPFGDVLRGRTIVMHAAGQDLEVFRRSIGVVPDDLFDTQIAASFLGMSSIGLAPLVKKLVGADLAKGDRLTDWLARPLPDGALAYAEADVVHLFDLHDDLLAGLEARDRVGWARSECDAMVAKSLVDNDPDTAWWRVKEARRLRGRAAAIAQEVGKWREAHAASADRPLRSVLPDLALAGVAQRPPKDIDALGKIRGLRDRGIPKAVRGDLMDAIARGKELDLDLVRFPEANPVPSDVRGAVPLLSSWVSQRARELELDPAVLATRRDLEDFLRGDPDSRLAHGWRSDALAAEIEELLAGRAALSFERGVGLVLRREQDN